MVTNGRTVSFTTEAEAWVAAFPAASEWLAVMLMEPLSLRPLTFIPEAVKVPLEQVGAALTDPPTLTLTVRPFSEQLPDTE